MSPLKAPASATSHQPTTPTRHLTIRNPCVCHVTNDYDPQPAQKAASPLLEGCRRPNQQVGARRSKEDRKGEQGGKGRGEGRCKGNGRGRGPIQPPPSLFFYSRSEQGSIKTTRCLIQARFRGDFSPIASMMEQCGTHTLLHFECICWCRWQGQLHAAPFSFQTGAV